jgi:hypothetical protein
LEEYESYSKFNYQLMRILAVELIFKDSKLLIEINDHRKGIMPGVFRSLFMKSIEYWLSLVRFRFISDEQLQLSRLQEFLEQIRHKTP